MDNIYNKNNENKLHPGCKRPHGSCGLGIDTGSLRISRNASLQNRVTSPGRGSNETHRGAYNSITRAAPPKLSVYKFCEKESLHIVKRGVKGLLAPNGVFLLESTEGRKET